MTLPKDKKPKKQEIESMKIAVNEVDIRAIHPDKMEDFAAHMVEKLKESQWIKFCYLIVYRGWRH